MRIECSQCGDVPDVGFEMPDGDIVCASYECCYNYCKLTKAKIVLPESEVNNGRQTGD